MIPFWASLRYHYVNTLLECSDLRGALRTAHWHSTRRRFTLFGVVVLTTHHAAAENTHYATSVFWCSFEAIH